MSCNPLPLDGYTFARLAVGDEFGRVAVVALLAVMAVAAGRVVPALEAHATAHPTGQFEQLHVEPATPRMQITLARCNQKYKTVTFQSMTSLLN